PSMVSVTSAIEDLQLRQAGGDRVGGGLAQAADRRIAHRLGDVAEKHHVGTAIPVRRLQHALEDLLLALGADAAGHALPAGLVAKEPRDPKEDLPHVRGVVEDHDGAGAQRRPDRPGAVEAQGHVQLVGGDEGPRRAAPRLPSIQLNSAVPPPQIYAPAPRRTSTSKST